jgi:glutathione S-transferase
MEAIGLRQGDGDEAMGMTLYELAGADPALRFSPYCWRTRLALAHKGLAADAVPWRFTDKAAIAFSGQTRVPVLVDGGKTVVDSWAIAEYLDDTYPGAPLLGAPRAHARFINGWVDSQVHGGIARLVVSDIHTVLAEQDKEYFRQTREKALGGQLEALTADRAERVDGFRALLAPARLMLRHGDWLGGAAPDYADYILLGSLQWARCVSRFELLAQDDPLFAWRARGLALFDGLLGRAKTV